MHGNGLKLTWIGPRDVRRGASSSSGSRMTWGTGREGGMGAQPPLRRALY